MKIVKFFVLFLVLCLILGVGKAFESKIDDFNFEETGEIVENKLEDIKVDDKEITKPDITKKPEIEQVTTEKAKTKNEVNKSDVIPTTKTTKKAEPITTQKVTTTSSIKKNEESITTQKPENITTKKVQIWEALGMSEEDYKYKPAFAGDRVDFKNYEECFNHGYSYEPYLNGEETFNCSEVISLSGNFLGIMFKTEKNIKDKS